MRKLICVLLGLLLSGCVASQQEIQDLSVRVAALESQANLQEKRLAEIQKGLRDEARRLSALEKRLSALEKETGALSEKRAEILAEIERTRAEIARLNGLFEELSYQQKQDREAFSEFQGEVLKRLTALEKGQPTVKPSRKAEGPSEKKPSEEALYQEGLSAMKQKKYEAARRAFRRYLELYPEGKYAANAYFWIGESYYAERRYEEAILEYQKVIDRYPKHYKVPAALLKQGLAFLRIGDTEAARILFEKILKNYPRSEQAPLARKYLKRLRR